MHRLISRLAVYADAAKDDVMSGLADVCKKIGEGGYEKESLIGEVYARVGRLLEAAGRYGFDTNLWHNYIAFILATSENPFTLAAERSDAGEGPLSEFAKADLLIFKKLFDYDFSKIEDALGINCLSMAEGFGPTAKIERAPYTDAGEKISYLCEKLEAASDDGAFYAETVKFYKKYGVGKFGLNKAFRLSGGKNDALAPISSTGGASFDDIIGYDAQKKKLIENTEAFLAGRPANNVLLFGDAGTGKSTSVKALLNEYCGLGLRMIEVYKHEFGALSKIISEIKNRNYRFIIYMDDLSFEDFETDYKYLKAVIEGGLEPKPENVLIYATSNRRHLIRETWSDRSDMSDDELHRSDTMQEKLSLAARFGVSIGFYKPSRQEYHDIVMGLAKKHPRIRMSREELCLEADRWELAHGGISGRCARQFIDCLAGTRS